MERICSKCEEIKKDCMVTISDAKGCKREILCSGCRMALSGDIKIISSALEMFLKAIDTRTAGGGLNGCKFMLELLGEQIAEDHGIDAAIKRLQLAVEALQRKKNL